MRKIIISDPDSINAEISFLVNKEVFIMDTFLGKTGELSYYFNSRSDLFTIRVQTYTYPDNKLLICTYETEIYYTGPLEKLEYKIKEFIDCDSLVSSDLYSE